MDLRKAFPPHHTATSDAEWDVGENERNLKLDANPDYYARAYAWRDPDKDPRTKSAYKFLHHFVSKDGEIGPASIRACRAGIAALNGARTEPDIPESDREGVWRHLAAHIEDAGLEPAPLAERFAPVELERRCYSVEFRVEPEGVLVGHAAVFDREANLPFFRELFRRGAFAASIEADDIRALWNHDPNFVLGRNTAGTLMLEEDEIGLAVKIFPPDTQWARDLLVSIRRGDISQMSVGFERLKEDWDEFGPKPLRIIQQVRLWDVSPVTFPAYKETSIAVRSEAVETAKALARLTRRADSDWQESVAALRRKLADLFG